jgi:hypothetical protein
MVDSEFGEGRIQHSTSNLKTLSAGAPKGTGEAPVLPGEPAEARTPNIQHSTFNIQFEDKSFGGGAERDRRGACATLGTG